MASTTTNVELKRQQALTALLSSIAVKSAEKNVGGNDLSPQKIQDLANRLSDMLIDSDEAGGVMSKDGEILNEDGEPIVEITEPVNSDSRPPSSSTSLQPRASPPLERLSSEERERRRREREAWLDMLEAEEGAQEQRHSRQGGVENEREASKKVIPKSSTSALKEPKTQFPSIPASSLSESDKSTILPSSSSQSRLPESAAPLPGKKSVSFAEPETIERPSATDGEDSWGDVVPARVKEEIPPAFRVMRMDVMERTSSSETPFSPNTRRSPLVVKMSGEDSDDEDEDQMSSQPSDSDAFEDEDVEEGQEEDFEEEGEDFDEVMMQAEIAMEYCRRQGMLKEISQALPRPELPSSAQQLGDWDQQYVPLEANRISTKAHKSSISRFKAEKRLTEPVPIRFGKLQDGQLVARDGEVSGDEDDLDKLDERSQGIIKRILKGDPDLYKDGGGDLTNASATTSPDTSSFAKSPVSGVIERSAPRSSALASAPVPIPVIRPTASTSPTTRPPANRVARKNHSSFSTPTSDSTPVPITVTRPTTPGTSQMEFSKISASPIPAPTSMGTSDAYYDPAGGFTSVILTPEQAALPVSSVPLRENRANTGTTPFAAASTQRVIPMSGSVIEATGSRRRGGQTEGERISRFRAERM